MAKAQEISIRPKGDVSVIDIKGDVTAPTGQPIEDAYHQVTAAGAKKILLAFTSDCYINSGGIAILIGILSESKKNDQAIVKNLLMMVVGTFGVERGLILIVDVRDNRIQAMTQRGFDDAASAALSQAVDAGFPAKVHGSTGTAVLSESDASGLLSLLNLRTWIPFDVNERVRGGIGLGEKLIGDPYSP